MNLFRRVIFILAVIFLGALFIWPMWQITLIAPQYPNGVTMYIWINKLGGDTPSTLQNINILNHYIGMKYIEPDTIPELKYFKYVIMAMIGLGLLMALWGKRTGFIIWTAILIILCGFGVYDFYLWLYDYGHNLSETAPIKIPGMVYQPPLFGQKYLLNFLAKSYPYTGGWFVAGSIILGILASWFPFKKKTNERTGDNHLDGMGMARMHSETTAH
jgi:copper chaperone NosL